MLTRRTAGVRHSVAVDLTLAKTLGLRSSSLIISSRRQRYCLRKKAVGGHEEEEACKCVNKKTGVPEEKSYSY